MRTLHIVLPVTNLTLSLSFYGALGYEVVGEVPGSPAGDLTMLKLPQDPFVSVELVTAVTAVTSGIAPHSAGPPEGSSTFVVQVDSMADALAALADAGIDAEPPSSPDGSDHFLTAHLTDPDGHRIELVQWPPGHGDGLTAADWPGHDTPSGC